MSGCLVVHSPGTTTSTRTHSHTHILPRCRICLMNEHQLLKTSFKRLMSCVNVHAASLKAQIKLIKPPRTKALYYFCLFNQCAANQTVLLSIDTSICPTPKQQMEHTWQLRPNPFRLIMRLLWVGGPRVPPLQRRPWLRSTQTAKLTVFWI